MTIGHIIEPMTGEDLKNWRKKWGITQIELARLLGTYQETISRWEREKRGIPSHLFLALEALEKRVTMEGNMETPKQFSEGELKKVGVKIWLECSKCGVMWTPSLQPDGEMSKEDYWRCPKGCNLPQN